MSWNYRVVRHRKPLLKSMAKKLKEEYPKGYCEWFEIHEVFYNKRGNIDGMSKEPVTVYSESGTKKEFNWILKKMREAVNKPVVDYDTRKEIKD